MEKDIEEFGRLETIGLDNSHRKITSMDLLTMCNIFCVVSTQQRNKLTIPSEINPKIKIDKPFHREFRVSTGHHVVISGPILSHFDGTVFSILVALYIEKACSGGVLVCAYSDISKKLKKSTSSGSVRGDIHGSITRLKECNIKIYDDTQPLWMKSLFLDLETKGRGRSLKLVIQLNKWMVPQYEQGNYSIQKLETLVALSGEYQPALYRLLTTSKAKEVRLPIEEAYRFLADYGVKKRDFEKLTSAQKSDFKYYLKKIIKKMIEKGALDQSSVVEDQLYMRENTVH